MAYIPNMLYLRFPPFRLSWPMEPQFDFAPRRMEVGRKVAHKGDWRQMTFDASSNETGLDPIFDGACWLRQGGTIRYGLGCAVRMYHKS